jgi:hypothetical protein
MRSLGDTQSAVQRHLSGALWNWVVRPVLMIPALPAFLALGVLLLWLGNRSGGDAEPGYLGGSRPPRRRRPRGGLS